MKTRIFNALEGEGYLPEVAKILNSDGIVAIPTETVYGLAASAYSDSAIKKVFSAKGRPQDNPLIVHVSSVDMLKEIAKDIPNAAYALAEKFWPGPLTMVLKKGDGARVVCKLELPELLVAPVLEGDKIGEAVFSLDGEIIGRCDITSDEAVDKISFYEVLWRMLKKFIFCPADA